MKIGLIADIHGNSFALRQVLGELNRTDVDSMVCLGDVAVLGPDPAGAIALVRERAVLVVQGNVDRWLVNRLDDLELHASPNPVMRELATWSLDQLDDDSIGWLDSLPMMSVVHLGDERELLAFHGSSRSNDEVIRPASSEDQVHAMLPLGLPEVICGGHTHVQYQRTVDDSLFVNPGSVGLPGIGPGTPGLPINEDVAWAEYAVLTIGESGVTGVEFRRTQLDIEAMIEWSRPFAMPAQEWWVSKWRAV